ncbi:MAG TPA: hypothetical protein VJT67_15255 [Longimicrobiaceae bacterium]|nr:hypothetical protein [Longimicrobiaceae bacterium]
MREDDLTEPPLREDDELMRILDERFEAHRLAPETSIPWEEVRARLFAMDD